VGRFFLRFFMKVSSFHFTFGVAVRAQLAREGEGEQVIEQEIDLDVRMRRTGMVVVHLVYPA
jgi:hypothetical protein